MIKSNEQGRIYSPPVWEDKARGVTLTDSTCLGGNITHLMKRGFSTFIMSPFSSITFIILCSLFLHRLTAYKKRASSDMQSLPLKQNITQADASLVCTPGLSVCYSPFLVPLNLSVPLPSVTVLFLCPPPSRHSPQSP